MATALLLLLPAALAAGPGKGRQRLQPLAAEDKAAYTILANENADAAAMLKQAEKANAAWRNRAGKILQRVDSAEEKGPSGKRQKVAKATRLVDADDRPGARRLPAGSAALPASAGEAASEEATAGGEEATAEGGGAALQAWDRL